MLEMDWQASVQDARGEEMPQVAVVVVSLFVELLVMVVGSGCSQLGVVS
jgi:hypothetical protein